MYLKKQIREKEYIRKSLTAAAKHSTITSEPAHRQVDPIESKNHIEAKAGEKP